MLDFGHIMRRQEALQKATILGNVERRKRRRTKIKWIDSVKEGSALCLQDLSKDIAGGGGLIHRVTISLT